MLEVRRASDVKNSASREATRILSLNSFRKCFYFVFFLVPLYVCLFLVCLEIFVQKKQQSSRLFWRRKMANGRRAVDDGNGSSGIRNYTSWLELRLIDGPSMAGDGSSGIRKKK